LFRIAGVNGWHWQSALLQVLASFLTQVLLKKCSIASIGFESRVGYVSSKGHNSNDKVDDNIEYHPGLDRGWQPTIDLHAGPHNQKGKQHIQNVTNSIKSMLASMETQVGIGDQTYAGINPKTLPQPNRMPQQLKRARSRR
jgi:hypothetical protein